MVKKTSSKPKKRRTFAADKHNTKTRTDVVNKSNPFDLHVNRLKHDVLDRKAAVEFLKRTLFHPGKTKCEEQKREASEKYEERCEPSINKITGSRYCPDIKTWTAFQNYEIGSGMGR
ncbi:unnamed protein product [Adineta steineri]|uniref:Uncharacterized protein n=1 Tax=Adineta steineri TaxID=433720 RepID=A0A815QCB4_9BILA|nr:unnamed protein product [Adineta steineri]